MEASFDRIVLTQVVEVRNAANAAVQAALARAIVHWAEKVADSYTDTVDRVGELSLNDLDAIFSALPPSARIEDVVAMLTVRLTDVWQRRYDVEADIPWEVCTYDVHKVIDNCVIAVRPRVSVA